MKIGLKKWLAGTLACLAIAVGLAPLLSDDWHYPEIALSVPALLSLPLTGVGEVIPDTLTLAPQAAVMGPTAEPTSTGSERATPSEVPAATARPPRRLASRGTSYARHFLPEDLPYGTGESRRANVPSGGDKADVDEARSPWRVLTLSEREREGVARMARSSPATATPVRQFTPAPIALATPQPTATPLPTATPRPTPVVAAPTSTANRGEEVAAVAARYDGARYLFGGHSPDTGFDCSGFTWYVYDQAGLKIPLHDLAGQLNAGPRVERAALLPGDLVFFQNTYKPGLSHGGVYVGGGRFVHAVDEKAGVRYDNLDDRYWQSHYLGASRPWQRP